MTEQDLDGCAGQSGLEQVVSPTMPQRVRVMRLLSPAWRALPGSGPHTFCPNGLFRPRRGSALGTSRSWVRQASIPQRF